MTDIIGFLIFQPFFREAPKSERIEKAETVAHNPRKRREAKDEAIDMILKKSKSDSSDSVIGY